MSMRVLLKFGTYQYPNFNNTFFKLRDKNEKFSGAISGSFFLKMT